jgi:biopolymer transport protein TolR
MSLLLKRREPLRAELNITSLLDITMNILCVFILVAPILEQGIDVDLPRATAQQMQKEDETVTVSLQEINENGQKIGVVFVDRREMNRAHPFDDLRETLARLQQQKPKLAVIIRADKNFKYDAVIRVLDVIRTAGITTLSLATQAE